MFLSAGIEGWGDRHGRTPGYPQTWRERKRKNEMVEEVVTGF